MTIKIGASSTKQRWNDIDWRFIRCGVNRLQMRIAKATKQRRFGKVKALQRLLTRSYSAKILAVKKVTSSKGSNTAGIDGKLYKTGVAKMKLALSLKARGYKASPMRRIYIPKKGLKRKLRPISIPTMYDRSMQGLYCLALEPVAEMSADPNSYGFRAQRCTADAIEQAFVVLCQKLSGKWILECDIEDCFNKISHQWLLDNIILEKRILHQWLKAGYMEKQILYLTFEGTGQGSGISPLLANITLDGMENMLKSAAKPFKKQVHTIRYADDSICVSKSSEVLEVLIRPKIEEFLKERGLSLSQEKTKISNVEQGFNYLGFNIRKFKGHLIIQPSKENVQSFLKEVRNVIRCNKTICTERLIGMINPKVRGFCNYYKTSCASKAFSYIDDQIYRHISRWTARRHQEKNFDWIRKKYFRKVEGRNWVFFGTKTKKDGTKEVVDLLRATSFKMKRHIKIRGEAGVHDPDSLKYLAKRRLDKIRRRKESQQEAASKISILVDTTLAACLLPGF